MAKSKRKERSKDKERDDERKAKKRRREDAESSGSSVTHRSSSKHRKDSSNSDMTKQRKHSKRDQEADNRKHRHKKGNSKNDAAEKKKYKKKKESREPRKEDSDRRKHKRQGNDHAEPMDSSTNIVEEGIQISSEDYFARVTEFKVWLLQKKKVFFEDLSSADAHELFDKFVKDWNRGKLGAEFYEGRLPEELVARTKKTQHKWGFVGKLTDREQMQLASTNDSVHASTEKVKGVASNVPALPAGSAAGGKIASSTPPPPPRVRGGGNGGSDSDDEEDKRRGRKRRRKKEREQHAVVLDEIAPKETGRQGLLDKRREVGARTHAASKEREDAADGLDMKEADIMGGGDSFHDALKRSQGGKQRRQTAKQEMLLELAAREEEKRIAFMAQMGIKPGQKITIQPRRDG